MFNGKIMENPLSMVIFHSYVCLPEGTLLDGQLFGNVSGLQKAQDWGISCITSSGLSKQSPPNHDEALD